MTTLSVERSISPLRQRMLEDMAMRGLRSDMPHNAGLLLLRRAGLESDRR